MYNFKSFQSHEKISSHKYNQGFFTILVAVLLSINYE
jgi:hypothetical protein